MTTSRSALRGLTGVALAAALTGSAVAAATSPAHAAPRADYEQCPDAYPVSQLEEGQSVEGRTTTRGTSPEAFTGSYVGAIEDGIGRGRDLLVFRLEGSRITQDGNVPGAGIWAGISGSPVYDPTTGDLIGSVSYGFNDGDDTLAGVTPASYIYGVKDLATPDKVALRSKKAALARQGVTVPDSATLRPISQTRSVSGFATKDLGVAERIGKRAGLEDPRVRAGSAARASSTAYPIVAGGNVASTWSYGDVTTASTGSVTAVCGDDVFAFGHPDAWSGSSNQTLHGASAIGISRGSEAYKLSNTGAPVGTLLQDRLEGIYGKTGPLPITVDLRSTTTFDGRTIPGSTQVSQKEELPYLTAMQTASDTLTALNAERAGGESRIGWKISFTRKDGRADSLTRSQRYSTRSDLVEDLVSDVAGDVATLQENRFEDVTITGISITNDISSLYRAYRIARVDRKIGSKITRVREGSTQTITRGKPITLRFTLESADRFSSTKTTTKWLTFTTSKRAASGGLMTVSGNAYDWDFDIEDFEDLFEIGLDSDYYYDDEDEERSPYLPAPAAPKSLDQVLSILSKQPRQDDLTVFSGWRSRYTGKLGTFTKSLRADAIVFGDVSFNVRYR